MAKCEVVIVTMPQLSCRGYLKKNKQRNFNKAKLAIETRLRRDGPNYPPKGRVALCRRGVAQRTQLRNVYTVNC